MLVPHISHGVKPCIFMQCLHVNRYASIHNPCNLARKALGAIPYSPLL